MKFSLTLPVVFLFLSATHGSKYPKYFGKFVEKVGYCGGYISSPNYPSRYQNGDSGYYSIQVPDHHYIVLTVLSMDIEDSASCSEDHISLYDGADSTVTLLSKLCGSLQDGDHEYQTSGSQLFVYFESSQRQAGNNFILRYEARTLDGAVSSCPAMTASDGCDGGVQMYTERSATLTSPHYPGNYPNQADCKLAIDVSKFGQALEFSWSAFNIEGHSSCKYDALQLYAPDTDTLYGPYCGLYTPRLWKIDSPLVYVMFRSDLSVTKSGFSLSYTASGQPDKRLIDDPISTANQSVIANYTTLAEKFNMTSTAVVNISITIEPYAPLFIDPIFYDVPHNNPQITMGKPGKSCGSQAIGSSRPWHAEIRTPEGYAFCGGTIVHPYYIITAAHCVMNDSPEEIRVAVGSQSKNYIRPETIVEHIYLHPVFNTQSPASQANDIAVLKLAQPLKFSSAVSPVCLSHSEVQDYSDTDLYATIWDGVTGVISVQAKVITNSECDLDGTVDTMLCVQSEDRDSCMGPSGSALVARVDNSYMLLGILSSTRSCIDTMSPRVYIRIPPFYNWLIRVAGGV